MWNFGIPYILKQYLDLLLQPGLTFGFDPAKGYFGLVTGKKAALVYSRGGAYGPGTGAEGYDHQTRYLGQALGFIGLTDQQNILVEPTLAGGPDAKDAAVSKAKLDAARIAAIF
jgi:FMN-dependent NADH-azoreductase